MALIKKISIKTVCGAVKRVSEPTDLMRVFGIASGVVAGESSYGEWRGLVGRFKAVNLETGEAVVSGKCFLPDIVLDMVISALADAESVEFDFIIGVRPDENSATGYSYTATPLLEATENDPLAALEKKTALALEAQKAAKKPAKKNAEKETA